MNETLKTQIKIYDESEWFRCWISNIRDGGWVVGEIDYPSGLHYIVNSDSNGELLIQEDFITKW